MFDLFECFLEDSLYNANEWDMGYDGPGFADYPSANFDGGSHDGYVESIPADLFPFLEDLIESGDTSLFDSIELPETNDFTDTFAFDFGNILDDLWMFVEPFFSSIEPGECNLISVEQFTHDGRFDPINQCVVEGNVANDISFLQEQTGQTCSLMAQEQFIARMSGNHIPEGELERIALEMGVYDPNLGTFADGWNAILDYFGVENTQYFNADTNMLDVATQKGDDVLIGVDARIFYDDPTFPPGSGHAVTIVGRGVDPTSGQLNGYYITDSNRPGQAHFKTVAELEQFWQCDMVTVPTSMTA